MKLNLSLPVVVIISLLALSGCSLLVPGATTPSPSPSSDQTLQETTSEDVMMQDEQMDKDDAMMESNKMESEKMMDGDDKMMDQSSSRYQDYSPEAFAAASGKKRVLFFHASWCPTCKAADQQITSALDTIPEDVVVFKTDYDTNTQLRNQHGVTYQHTFVQVDASGDQVTKWNGGATKEIISNTQS